jgi:2-iminobutanoate/2-iminopropanoate deaminase
LVHASNTARLSKRCERGIKGVILGFGAFEKVKPTKPWLNFGKVQVERRPRVKLGFAMRRPTHHVSEINFTRRNAMPRTKVSVPDVAEVAPGLWSNAIRVGDMLFISGQVARPFEGGTGIVGKDEYEQTRQIFSRIDRIIKAAGGTMDNLVKMTIYVVDIKNNTEVWRARREFFTGDFPASTLVEVRSLAKPEVLVEIETVAHLGKN